MGTSSKVAVIRSDRRRGAVAEALAILASELAPLVARDPQPVVLPDLQNPDRPWSCTHRDTLSALVDAVLAAGASSLTVVGGTDESAEGPGSLPARLGYPAELWGRPARFVGLGAATTWAPVRWIDTDGRPRCLRAAAAVAASRCRIVIATPRTHETFRLGLGLASLAGVLHPEDRRALGVGKGLGLIPVLESARGRLVSAWLAMRSVGGGMRLTRGERRHLEALREVSDRLAALAGFLRPSLSVIDGFSAMEGEGPKHGRRVSLGAVIAGTDPVAVDAVAATIMGFEPMEIPHLREAHRMRLGTADLSRIEIAGDAPAKPARRLRRHSADPLHKLVVRTTPPRLSPLPRPHFGTLSSHQREPLDAHRH